ncbi:replication protein A 70 kDa DNA-binding subunit B-like [Primulina eburnea]|uniref:replication protein A 70 kDa DNA-binding subunit B-like n=1 Tax=Primulina eburnea TaxID=1245227 RepID=UPI003C6C0287
MASSDFSSITSLQPNQKATTLVLKVLRQGSSLFSKANSKPIRKIIFLDEEGTMIYGIVFANAMQYFHEQLKFNRSYNIFNPDIREINKNFPNINPKIELVLQTNTTITETDNIISFSNNTFSFCEFGDIKKSSQDAHPLDVIGVIMKVKQSIQFRRDDNSTGCRREVILMNLLHDTVTINLWDDLAFNEGQWLEEMVNEKPIIAFSNMKIQPYQDTVQLKSTYTTTIFLNPPCTESSNLNIWLNSGFNDHNLNDLWLATKLKSSKEITINQLLNERKNLTEVRDKVHHFFLLLQ